MRHPRPNGLDDAGRVEPRGVGQGGRSRVPAGAYVGIDRIDAGRAQAQQDFPRPGTRVGDLRDLQDLGPAELRDSDRFHETIL